MYQWDGLWSRKYTIMTHRQHGHSLYALFMIKVNTPSAIIELTSKELMEVLTLQRQNLDF